MTGRTLLLLTAAAACARAGPPPAAPAAPRGVAGPAPAAALLGRWEYVAPSATTSAGPSLGAGFRVTIEFDSTAGPSAFGRVTQWFAGDVGLAPTLFGRVACAVTPHGAASLTIPFARSAGPAVTVEGLLQGDTLRIKTARRGDEQGPFSTAAGAAFVRREEP